MLKSCHQQSPTKIAIPDHAVNMTAPIHQGLYLLLAYAKVVSIDIRFSGEERGRVRFVSERGEGKAEPVTHSASEPSLPQGKEAITFESHLVSRFLANPMSICRLCRRMWTLFPLQGSQHLMQSMAVGHWCNAPKLSGRPCGHRALSAPLTPEASSDTATPHIPVRQSSR